MTVTWRDGVATSVTAALAIGYAGLVQEAAWTPITSVRWFAVVFLVVGQTTCAVCAADLAQAGVTRSPGFFVGPVAFAATVLAIVTGSASVLGVAVVAVVALWALSTSRRLHLLSGHRGHQGAHA